MKLNRALTWCAWDDDRLNISNTKFGNQDETKNQTSKLSRN